MLLQRCTGESCSGASPGARGDCQSRRDIARRLLLTAHNDYCPQAHNPTIAYRTMTATDSTWIVATSTNVSGHPLTEAQIASWRNRGFAFVAGLFEEELVGELKGEAVEG